LSLSRSITGPRFYRHYSVRLCDIVDTVRVICGNPIDFDYLKYESKRAGIRKDVRSYLAIVDGYYAHYADNHLFLPGVGAERRNFQRGQNLLRMPDYSGFLSSLRARGFIVMN
jgi:hypothetical protein